MWDFLTFRKMLTPIIIQLFFWLLVIVCIIGAIYNFYYHAFLYGLQVLIIGPIFARLLCEFFIVFFKINETLTDLKNTVQGKP